ncbi:MAG: hypothetical protein FWE80_08105, partial [Oscillospiraceae bacterium]|nr:hypothetical protein [Oscillospiraceae bacterium]
IGPGGDFARALYQGGGNTFFEEKNGRLQMGCQGTQTFDFVDKMRKMYMQDKSMGRNFKDFKVSDYARMFINGNALFFAYMPGLPDLREMDTEWGVLPLPKASKEQEQYMSGVDHNATVFGVTKTNADLDKVGILLDALGYYALELELIYWPDYEETYWWHEQDARIVADYICKSAQYDMALLMQNVDNVFRIPMDLVNGAMFGGITDFSSMVESQKDKVNKTLDKFFMDWERDAEK